MDIFSSLSDNQIAIIGCIAALFSAGGLMSLSYHIGQRERVREQQERELLKKTQQSAESLKKAA